MLSTLLRTYGSDQHKPLNNDMSWHVDADTWTVFGASEGAWMARLPSCGCERGITVVTGAHKVAEGLRHALGPPSPRRVPIERSSFHSSPDRDTNFLHSHYIL